MSGFEAFVPVRRPAAGGESLVSVEAVSMDGRRWRSRTHRVAFAHREAASAHAGELLARRSGAALAGLVPRGSRVMIFTHELSYGGGQLWLHELLRQLAAASELDCTVVLDDRRAATDDLEDLGMTVHITTMPPMNDVAAYEGRIHELALLIRTSGVLADGARQHARHFPAVDAAARAGVPCLWAIHESFDLPVFRHIGPGPRRDASTRA